MAAENDERRKVRKYCIAPDCTSTDRDPNVTFFTLPRDEERRRRWLLKIRREDLAKKEDLKIKSYVLCSAHFKRSDMKIVTKLTNDAVPSDDEDDGDIRFCSHVKAPTKTKETQTEPFKPMEYNSINNVPMKHALMVGLDRDEKGEPIKKVKVMVENVKKEPGTDEVENIKKEPETDEEENVKKEPETDEVENIKKEPETDEKENDKKEPETDEEENFKKEPETDEVENVKKEPETDEVEDVKKEPETDEVEDVSL